MRPPNKSSLRANCEKLTAPFGTTMKSLPIIIFLLCATVFLLNVTACDEEPSNPLNDPGEFAEVYVDLLIAGTVDSLTASQRDSIIAAHGYSREQVESATRFFSAEAERWQAVLDSVVSRLDKELEKAKQMESAAMDSINAMQKVGKK